VGAEANLSPSPADGEAIIQVSGRIKWFDSVKGYGFIKPANGLQGDVLLHQSCDESIFDISDIADRDFVCCTGALFIFFENIY